MYYQSGKITMAANKTTIMSNDSIAFATMKEEKEQTIRTRKMK